MQCLNPVWLDSQKLSVPCGKCVMCRIALSREWATRVLHESDYWDQSCFTTLTYNNEHLPKDGSLHKDELQKFFKRLRKYLGLRKMKYFACGEYGDEGHRPHYHAILFGIGLSDSDQQLIRDAWPFGFVKSGTVTYDSARYVADYVFKKYSGTKKEEYYGTRQVPFRVSSQGLGLRFALDNQDQIVKNLNITVRGQNVGLPKYYVKKLAIDVESRLPDIIKRRDEAITRSIDQCKGDIEKAYILRCESRKQKAIDVESRGQMIRKGKF